MARRQVRDTDDDDDPEIHDDATRDDLGDDLGGNSGDGEDEPLDRDWRVASVRSDPASRFYDPRYARPLSSGNGGSAAGPMRGWGEFDPAFLDDGRAAVPAFPLEVLPPFWRDWARDTARAAGAPVDYVALSLIAGVAGVCGAGVQVRAAPGWREPLVLWLALVGTASSGKSPALAPLRALLAALAPAETADDTSSSSSAPPDPPLRGLGDALTADARGALLWCDEPAEWLARLAAGSGAARAQLLRAWSPQLSSGPKSGGGAVGLLASLSPDRVAPLAKIGPELAARFLFTWPNPSPYSPLAARTPAADGEALAALRRLLALAGTAAAPSIVALADDALPPLDSFLAALHREHAEAEGLDQAWQGKGRGTVVRLLGCLALLGEAVGPASGAPANAVTCVAGRTVAERAIMLWRDYLRLHARAVLQPAEPDDIELKARRVARWLKAHGADSVSREDIRRNALGRTVDAARTDKILYRLQSAGIVKQLHYSLPQHGGRPPNRWEVNPRLIAAGASGGGGPGGKG